MKCSSCGDVKDSSEFWRRGGSRGNTLQSMCKTCTRLKRKLYRRETKRKVIALLGGKCALCGHTSRTGVSLSIDHKNSSEKHPMASNLLQWKWGRVEKELESGDCWLLCMNCHMEIEEDRRLEGTDHGVKQS